MPCKQVNRDKEHSVNLQIKVLVHFINFILNHDKWMMYRSMFGDDVLGAMNLEMVQVARGVEAASKFTGSGGAVVVFCPDGSLQVKQLEDACDKAGFRIVPIEVVPSLLNEVDLTTLGN
uniref:GHMP kinase C-terminal domain-containing protein n=1 Tax=Cannabis sativa TaxID=3483 RepID=A0A803QLE5_CANSA